MEDGDNDLLGGDGGNYGGLQAGGEEVKQFESSFPAMDTQNQVSHVPGPRFRTPLYMLLS